MTLRELIAKGLKVGDLIKGDLLHEVLCIGGEKVFARRIAQGNKYHGTEDSYNIEYDIWEKYEEPQKKEIVLK